MGIGDIFACRCSLEVHWIIIEVPPFIPTFDTSLPLTMQGTYHQWFIFLCVVVSAWVATRMVCTTY